MKQLQSSVSGVRSGGGEGRNETGPLVGGLGQRQCVVCVTRAVFHQGSFGLALPTQLLLDKEVFMNASQLLQNLSFSCAIFLFIAACESKESSLQIIKPQPSDLIGLWHYDSTGGDFYNSNHKFISGGTEPMKAGAFLTIGEKSWVYSGSVREIHDYTWTNNQLVIRRIIDPQLIKIGYAKPESLGKPSGYPNKMDVRLLTPHQMILRDSAADPDGCIRVSKYYYSR
ncbi:hypothetical protein [Hymenobacter cellulosivorans]|uniref:Lipocalin-like domain-containing protein n=1 Tax=Hymenobacter cellulosivorans TaxID=2932249 RepID=A0ABY4F8P6_9BACT|nr:hypothetical protein [Hymenobacter cellulosivorans]UOQ52890.1 hypothetical protein MUN80_24500 [Hymenobacter cellulosivorans]